MADLARSLLVVEGLVTGYGKRRVVDGVSLDIGAAEIVAIIGHNGAGKSTLLKAMFGMLPIWSGTLTLDGAPLSRPTPGELIRAGLAYVPQGNRVFTDLTVRENLRVSGVTLRNGDRMNEGIDQVLALFPALRSRLSQRAGTLSGGEKQMVALASALVLSPRLVLLDEPSLGLAPPLVVDALHHIRKITLDWGTAVLIVEQKVREVLKIADRVHVLKNGRVSYSGPAEFLRDESKLREVFL